ncbi:MAG: AAA family ATPase, partial [Chloroflexi bacterium]|nr:AAA family ATPase [Chloroflexota bacterium]
MSQVKFLVFGTPRLQRDDQPLALGRRKALALLAYLAVTGRSHSREALATLLWPEQDQSTGLTNLRSELYRLRKLLGDEVLQVEPSHIGLTQPPKLWLDVAHFRERLTVAQQHDHPADELCEACVSALTEAVALYTEDFMTGFNLPDNLTFDEWQFFQAESLRQAFAQALQQLIAWHSHQQVYQPAIAYARRWLALDELHEPAHRQLMRLYAQAGQQLAAMRQYEICQRLLDEELGVAPEAATQELADAIKARRFPDEPHPETALATPSLSTVLAVPYYPPFLDEEAPTQTTTPVFVARENELAALAATLETARAGQGQLLFVIGGAGRGKTMLVQEFARRAQADDLELIVVSGYGKTQTGSGDPYLPFREALEMLTGDVEALWAGGLITTTQARRLWTLLPVAVPALLEYGPDLIETFVSGQALLDRAATIAPTNPPWLQRLETLVKARDPRQLQQKHIFAQITAVLKAVAAQQPLLLILEDLHWADTASISLLFHLSRSMESSPMMIVGTYRPDEVAVGWGDEGHPLAHITGELKRQHGDIWLDLGELAALEGRRFVNAYLDSQPNRLDESFRQALFAHTGGHALVLRHGQDPKTTHLGYASWDLWFLGYPDQARHQSETAVSLAQELSHPHSLAHAFYLATMLRWYFREGQATWEGAAALATLANERDFLFWISFSHIMRGAALTLLGQPQAGIDQLNQGATMYYATGATMLRTNTLALLAEAYGNAGEPEQG